MRIRPNRLSFTDKLFWMKSVCAGIIGILAAYFPTSFFFNFYPAHYQFILLSLIFQSTSIVVSYLFLGASFRTSGFNLRKDWTSLIAFLEALCLGIATTVVVWKFPDFFNRRILFMDNSMLPLFALLSLVTGFSALIFLIAVRTKDIHVSPDSNPVFQKIQANLPGMLLALIF